MPGMTIWTPDPLPRRAPLYREIADAVGEAVRRGDLRPGDRLPTHRDLARSLDVNVVTVTRGYAEAARRGLVDGEVGRGTFVRGRAPPLEPLDAGPGFIDLAFNLPVTDRGGLDVAGLMRAFADEPEASCVFSGYTTTGAREHRETGAEHLRAAGLDATADRVAVTSGAQHAMTLAFAALAEPGEVVLAEELTYPGIHALARVLNLRLVGVPMDRDGPLPDALDELADRHRPKAFYTMPTVQNPVGHVVTDVRRRELAEVARHHGLPLVEDDTYAFLCEDAPPPLATFAPELTVHLSSLSKGFTAGLRTGFLLVPPDGGEVGLTVERLSDRVAAFGWMASPVATEMACRWIRDGSVARTAAWKRAEMAARRELVDELLPGLDLPSHRNSAHVWLELPGERHAEDFVGRARRLGVAVAPSSAFAVGRARGPQAVRVCIGTPRTREAAAQGLRVLAEVLGSTQHGWHTLV